MLALHNTLSYIPFLLLVLCATSQAFAVPWTTSDNSHYAATQRHSPPEAKHRGVFPQLTWLRDTAIEKVFGVPTKSAKAGSEKPNCASHTSSSQIPATLLAKYGGDVVLRFNLSTPHEEQALAEAADTLFLDVWEFTSNWADIRLREDDVRQKVPTIRLVLTKRRSHLYLDYYPNHSRMPTLLLCPIWPSPYIRLTLQLRRLARPSHHLNEIVLSRRL